MFLESKYVALLSNRLRNYRRLSADRFQFSCVYCGDSKTHKRKARGSVYDYKGKMLYGCFNCKIPKSAEEFLEDQDPYLYGQYLREKLGDRKIETHKEPKQEPIDLSVFKDLKKITELEPFHPASKYVRDRKIPEKHWDRLYYCPEFKAWTNTLVPRKFEEPIKMEEARLIIPFVDKESAIGYMARSMDPKAQLRYIAITLDKTKPKIFGLDRVDFKKKFYCFEGPIDSLFMDNSIAVGSTNLMSVPIENATLVFDNQPRNKELCAIIDRAIDKGYSVVVWPPEFKWKDVNESAIDGYDFARCINENTYNGLMARIKFNEWKK